MKVRELAGRLENLNPDAEIEIYLHHHQESKLEGHEYVLCEVEVNINTGWYGLITLEPGEIKGC